MRPSRLLVGLLACFACLAATARAETPASPLRFIPDDAGFVVQVKSARQLVQAFTSVEALADLAKFPQIKELLASTTNRRLLQLLAYFEKRLEAKWPELLDKLAGNGIVLAVKLGTDPAPSLLVLEGTDEKLMAKFYKLGLEVIEQELARQEVKERPTAGKYEGVETYHLGKDAHYAQVGAALLITNTEEGLHKALDLHLGRSRKSLADNTSLRDAEKLLPKDSLATLWLNMEPVMQTPAAKEFFKRPREAALTVVFGHYLDVIGRSKLVSAALCKEKDGFLTTVRLPAGKKGMGPEAGVFLPPKGQPSSRPVLEPKGVLYSDSFFLDLHKYYEDRVALFGEQVAKAFEEGDKNSGRFLSGLQFSKLFKQAGTYHRIIVANQPKVGYKKTPRQSIPAFAVVSELREPEAFAKSMDTVLRGAALLASTQIKLALTEEKYKDAEIVGWRFPEDAEFKPDVNDVRFNFSPCFVRVGNQFVACSTIELCRELVDLLQAEAKAGTKGDTERSTARLYAAGFAELLRAGEDQLITQIVLDQAVPAGEAREQVKQLIDLVARLGSVSVHETFKKNQFSFDLRVRLGK